MSFSLARFDAIFKKEFMHIFRDPFTIMFSMLLPLIIVIILGNSVEFNLNEISTVVVDHDKTPESRKLIETFSSSNYFKIYLEDSPKKAFDEIVKENAKVELFVPCGFGKDISDGKSPKVQLLLDGADNSSVAAIMNYIGMISSLAVTKIAGHERQETPLFKIKERFLFNPELNSKWFTIPGLGAVIIAIVAILLTTLTICREWEQGSMELLMSSPVQSSELILGKIAPYAILSGVGFFIVYLGARILFKVPMVGSHIILFSATFLFILNYLGIGLFISVTTKSQQLAIQKALMVGLMPTAMLSGFIFPIEYMPPALRCLTTIFPARWYVEIARNAFLQGSSFEDLSFNFTILFGQLILIVTVAILKFKRSLG
ncbi:MAG: ABC transporter permease [Holosporales bacterium]|jgi:ABC-2 type transport system permease protein|nr:ABC transporter permease [Holosporales bacterium]